MHREPYKTKEVVRSNWRVAMDLMRLLEKGTITTLVGLFRDVVRERLGKRMYDDV